jgi:hypothetical protein
MGKMGERLTDQASTLREVLAEAIEEAREAERAACEMIARRWTAVDEEGKKRALTWREIGDAIRARKANQPSKHANEGSRSARRRPAK